MNKELANTLKDEFIKITNIECTVKFMRKGITHKATILQDNQEGVYVFMNEEVYFKVGKAGLKSKARWNSHHYCLDKKSPSTFTKLFISDIEKFKEYFKEDKREELKKFPAYLEKVHRGKKLSTKERNEVRTWIQNNTSRMEFKLENNTSIYALDLLEKFITFKLNPIYEGKYKNHPKK